MCLKYQIHKRRNIYKEKIRIDRKKKTNIKIKTSYRMLQNESIALGKKKLNGSIKQQIRHSYRENQPIVRHISEWKMKINEVENKSNITNQKKKSPE